MGRLLAYPKDFSIYNPNRSEHTRGLDPEWYFTREAPGRFNGSAWDVSSTFPYSASIHNDIMTARRAWPSDKAKELSRVLKVDIRTFIEAEITHTVIWTENPKIYYYVMPPLGDNSAIITEVKHFYHVFNFVTQAETLLFKLRFADQVTDETEWHPDYEPSGESFTSQNDWEARREIQERWGYGAVPKSYW
jgi:hypothetical protein